MMAYARKGLRGTEASGALSYAPRVSREHRPHPRFLAQAEIEPLDVDGVRAVAVGTLMWAVAFVALLPFADRLRQSGADWWLWVCLTGVGLGLIGLAYCLWRRSRLRRPAAAVAGTDERAETDRNGRTRGTGGTGGTRGAGGPGSGRDVGQRGVGSVSS